MLYLTEYSGTGSRRNPFRPAGADGDWSAIDLRPDCTVADGYALLSTEQKPRKGLRLGEGFRDTFSTRVRNRVHNLLGVDVSRVRRFDVLAATLMMRPNGWKPLRPSGDRFEIWLGGLVWEFPFVQGGASDNFNRANETPIALPWTKGYGTNMNLASNAIQSAGSDATWYYAAAASSDDQYSECSLSTVSSGIGGPAVRSGIGVTDSFYALEGVSAGASAFTKFLSGSYTDLGAGGAGLANPVRISVSGTTIHGYNTSNSELPSSPKTDSDITTGQPGIFLYGGSADDWSGDNLAPPPSADAVVAWIRA